MPARTMVGGARGDEERDRLDATVETGLRRRDNSFDLLRVLGAAMVLVSHSYPLVGRAEPELGGVTLGGLGVVIFFTISGLLITRSWAVQPKLVPFLFKRGLRLMPGLAATVVLTALVIGPLVTTLSPAEYFRTPQTYMHVLDNLRLSTDYSLPGVFETTPFDGVNGSLWTLPIEVKAYLMVAALGAVGVLRRAVLALVVLASLVLALTYETLKAADGPVHYLAAALSRTQLSGAALELIAVFAMGALIYLHRARIPMRADLCVLVAGLWAASLPVGLAQLATPLLLPYVVIYVGLRPLLALAPVTRPGDVSYGLYLWAFPIQQCVVTVFGPGMSPYAMMALTFPVTYVLALASWRYVEAPALRMKSRVARPSRLPSGTARMPAGSPVLAGGS